ncbi:MAG: hypothetical protein AB3X44_17300 [Leptothrix sp. (in: b-proteobacteria)]
MSPRLVLPWVLALACGAAAAQRAEPPAATLPAAAAAVAPTSPSPSVRAPVALPSPATLHEPAVQKTVIDEDGVHIEELRVRGEVRSIKVQPKGVGSKLSYEVIPADSAHDVVPSPGAGHGMAGQRVWPLLSF